MNGMFYNCSNLEKIDLSSFDTRKVANMSDMFHGCSNLIKIDLSSFNTKKVTNMGHMFDNCYKLTEIKLNKNSYEKIKFYVNEDAVKIIKDRLESFASDEGLNEVELHAALAKAFGPDVEDSAYDEAIKMASEVQRQMRKVDVTDVVNHPREDFSAAVYEFGGIDQKGNYIWNTDKIVETFCLPVHRSRVHPLHQGCLKHISSTLPDPRY
jgi:surface protein